MDFGTPQQKGVQIHASEPPQALYITTSEDAQKRRPDVVSECGDVGLVVSRSQTQQQAVRWLPGNRAKPQREAHCLVGA